MSKLRLREVELLAQRLNGKAGFQPRLLFSLGLGFLICVQSSQGILQFPEALDLSVLSYVFTYT